VGLAATAPLTPEAQLRDIRTLIAHTLALYPSIETVFFLVESNAGWGASNFYTYFTTHWSEISSSARLECVNLGVGGQAERLPTDPHADTTITRPGIYTTKTLKAQMASTLAVAMADGRIRWADRVAVIPGFRVPGTGGLCHTFQFCATAPSRMGTAKRRRGLNTSQLVAERRAVPTIVSLCTQLEVFSETRLPNGTRVFSGKHDGRRDDLVIALQFATRLTSILYGLDIVDGG
jgi:hypothetical protein